MKVAVIGLGKVGSTIAYSLIPYCSYIYFNEIDKDTLDGQNIDLRDAKNILNPVCRLIKKATWDEINDCDHIVISAGIPRVTPETTDDQLLKVNLPIVKDIIENIYQHSSILLVTNPPELIAKELNLNNVIPIGQTLDDIRAITHGKTGKYILLKKGYTNWGISAIILDYVMNKRTDIE